MVNSNSLPCRPYHHPESVRNFGSWFRDFDHWLDHYRRAKTPPSFLLLQFEDKRYFAWSDQWLNYANERLKDASWFPSHRNRLVKDIFNIINSSDELSEYYGPFVLHGPLLANTLFTILGLEEVLHALSSNPEVGKKIIDLNTKDWNWPGYKVGSTIDKINVLIANNLTTPEHWSKLKQIPGDRLLTLPRPWIEELSRKLSSTTMTPDQIIEIWNNFITSNNLG